MKQELGPLQRQWVKALRSGKFKQGKGKLCRINGDGSECHCVLGVACEVVCPDLKYLNYATAIGSWLGRDEMVPDLVTEKLKLLDDEGMLRCRLGNFEFLASANDNGVTFTEIADFMEANPEAVFTEPA